MTTPSPALEPQAESNRPLLDILKRFKNAFWLIGLFSGIANLLMLAPTIYMLQVFDRVMLSGSDLTLVVMSLVTIYLFLMLALSEWFRSKLLVRAGVRLDHELSSKVFQASFESSLAASGKNPSRAFSDLIELRQFLSGTGTIAFFDAPWTPIYIAVLFLLHPVLGWLAIGFVVIQLAFARFGHASVLGPNERSIEATADENRFLQGKLRNAEVVESMGMEESLQKRWLAKRRVTELAQAQSQELTHRLTSTSKFIRYIQQSGSLAVGAVLAIEGAITAGAMIAGNVLTTRALAPIDQMVSGWKAFLSARKAYKRLESLLQSFPERDVALRRMDPEGHIRLQNVFATVPNRAEPILKDISFKVPAGAVTVILGPSGSGKSTLARVLVGIWPNVTGEVLLDERPLSGWSRDELGPHLGYLPQDVELFEGSIAENISRFAEISSDLVVKAAKSAGLHDMILRFPKGYDTPIGEAGRLLSGGQRQRIGLARALYGNPRFIVLDEPNANLDDVGERALMESVLRMKAEGRTVFLISHRPQVLSAADYVLLLGNGQIQAFGPRDAVLAALAPKKPAPGAEPTLPQGAPA